MTKDIFTQAAADLSKLEIELTRAGYENKTHIGTGSYVNVLGLLWDRASSADYYAELNNWQNEACNDRATQFWKEYHGWVAVVEQLLMAEQEIEATLSY